MLYAACIQELGLLKDFISSVEKQGNKNNICFIKNKINTPNKNSLFLENPFSCPTTKGASTATDFLKKSKSKLGNSCSHQTVSTMNHQFVFHDFSHIPSIFCSLFCSMFSARALPSSRMQKPSKQGACAPQSPSCLPKEQGMHLTSLPFPSVLVGYGDRQKRARSKLSWKTAFFQSRHSVKDSMSKS